MEKNIRNKKRPRLAVYRSNKNIYAQVIDDDKSMTLASANSLKLKVRLKGKKESGSNIALLVGEKIAAEAKKKGVKQVKFDRRKYRYHGRVKQLAEAARKGGLDF